jgi:hypothetical protein
MWVICETNYGARFWLWAESAMHCAVMVAKGCSFPKMSAADFAEKFDLCRERFNEKGRPDG